VSTLFICFRVALIVLTKRSKHLPCSSTKMHESCKKKKNRWWVSMYRFSKTTATHRYIMKCLNYNFNNLSWNKYDCRWSVFDVF
jgi:hypothetical protein